MELFNPYQDISPDATPLKAQLHLHTTNSDGSDSPAQVVRDYARLGYDVVCLTDHNAYPSPEDIETETDVLVIPAEEYSVSAIGHMGIFGAPRTESFDGLDRPDDHLQAVRSAAGAVLQFNHPRFCFDQWTVRQMIAQSPVELVEIYNAVSEELTGSADALLRWDNLLSTGMRIWGTATDDSHHAPHRDLAWIRVWSEKTQPAFLDALRAGRFYSSTGVGIDSIRLEGSTLTVESPDAQKINFIADRGSVRKSLFDRSGSCEIRDDDIYFRVDLYGPAGRRAWTQPIFVDSPAGRKQCAEHLDWLRNPTQ